MIVRHRQLFRQRRGLSTGRFQFDTLDCCCAAGDPEANVNHLRVSGQCRRQRLPICRLIASDVQSISSSEFFLFGRPPREADFPFAGCLEYNFGSDRTCQVQTVSCQKRRLPFALFGVTDLYTVGRAL